MREKLIELLQSAPADIMGNHGVGALADHLIANGVTLDNQVSSSKWIPVGERLPDVGENVLVCDAREDYVYIWENFGDGLWFGDEIIWETEDITHWMPLPEPPKGEE